MPATSKATRESHARVFDLDVQSLRELNQALHKLTAGSNETAWEVLNPKGDRVVA
ncbi:protein GlxC, partial [Mesorhizobium sp. M2D.F.Ca.ET.206.01.1.1]